MNLGQLRMLVAVAESGGFSPAALVLHVSQPTVSIHIRDLERELGLKLLERRGRQGVSLTPAGEIVVQHGKAILASLETIGAALDKLRRGTLGEISVAASYTSYTYILPRLLRQFGQAFPDIRLTIRTGLVSEVLQAVAGEQADVGIAWAPVPDEFAVYPLIEETFHLAVHRNHPLAREEEVAPADLAAHPFVAQSQGSSTRAFVEESFRRAGIHLRQVVEFGTPAGTKEGVLAGLGIGILAASAMSREVADGLLKPLTVEGLDMKRRLVLVHPRGAVLSGQAETFLLFLTEHLRSESRGAWGFEWRSDAPS